jgi:hypothetical protein
VTGSFLHVAQRHAGIQGGSDESVTQRVRSDPLADPGPAGDTSHDPPSGVPIESFPIGVEEDRAFHPFADSQVDSAGDALAPTASETRSPFNANSETKA